MSEKFKTHNLNSAYFVTLTIVKWVHVFENDVCKNIIISAIKHYQQFRGLILYGYCIMPTHLHLIAKTDGTEPLSSVLRDLKKFTSVKIVDTLIADKSEQLKKWLSVFENEGLRLKRIKNYKVWKDGNMPIELISNKYFDTKLDYIHQNPVKANLVEREEDYLFSSARNYSELPSVLEIEIP